MPNWAAFRELIAVAHGPNFPFFMRPVAGPAASWKSRNKYRLDYGEKRVASGAVVIDHYSAITPQKSRTAPRQLTGPTFPTLISAKRGSVSPVLATHRLRKVAQEIGPLCIDYGPIRGSPGAAMGQGFWKLGHSNSGNKRLRVIRGIPVPGGGGPRALWGRKFRCRPAGKPEWPRVWPPPGTGGRNSGLNWK